MALDFILRDIRIHRQSELISIGVQNGTIAHVGDAIEADCPTLNGLGRLAFPGFVDCHIHLDKALILDRCGTEARALEDAVVSVQRAKSAFVEEDVYARAAQLLTQAISNGTTRMRTFVEVDESARLVSLEALVRVQADFADAIDLEICAFAQDGTSGRGSNLSMLVEAMMQGAQLVGGCPYTDADPAQHINDIFDLAERFGTPVDFHLDFNLDPDLTHLPLVIEQTIRRGYGGRVNLGHVTNLSMLPLQRVRTIADQLADADISVVSLPATDLFLMGRQFEHSVPRGIAPLHSLAAAGVRTAIGTNNVLNPFTPFGNANLMRMADLYMHACQLGSSADLETLFDMVTTNPASILGKPHHIAVGQPATMVLLDAVDAGWALRAQAPAIAGWYRGRQTFSRSLTINALHHRQDHPHAFNA